MKEIKEVTGEGQPEWAIWASDRERLSKGIDISAET